MRCFTCSLRALLLLPVVAVVALLAACKPGHPNDILSQGDMEDLLYDYHLAIAMAQTESYGDGAKEIEYKEAVLRKHGITNAEFDSSMVYYMRHADQFHTIYAHIGERLDKEAISLGANANDMRRYGELTSSGDTANIWKGMPSLVFVTQKPLNYYNFEVKADSSFKQGDCFMLDFDAQFIYQDGNRDGIAVLAVQYANDSIASQLVHVQSSQSYTVRVDDPDNLGIKSVKGFFLLNNGDFTADGGSATTLKLMFIEHIRLIRMHKKKEETPAGADNDSIKRNDSIKGAVPVKGDAPMKANAPMKTDAAANGDAPKVEKDLPLPPPGKPGKPLKQLKPLKPIPMQENSTLPAPRELKKLEKADTKSVKSVRK